MATRNVVLKIRLTGEEYARLQVLAGKVPVSKFVRDKALGVVAKEVKGERKGGRGRNATHESRVNSGSVASDDESEPWRGIAEHMQPGEAEYFLDYWARVDMFVRAGELEKGLGERIKDRYRGRKGWLRQ